MTSSPYSSQIGKLPHAQTATEYMERHLPRSPASPPATENTSPKTGRNQTTQNRIAKEAGCEPVVVVLGAYEALIREQCKLQDVILASNTEWSQGMGTSLSRGVREFKNVSGIIVMTCDMPAVTADHLRNLASSGGLKASSYAGRKGVPAYFPSALFPKMIALCGAEGARKLLHMADVVELEGGEWDIDTPDDLANFHNLSAQVKRS